VASEVNSNFTTIYANALNRTGGTMTGTLTSRSVIPSTTATYDLGSTGTRFAAGWFSGAVTATSFSGAGTSLTGVALLGSTNTFTVAGTQASSASNTGSQLVLVQNTNSGAAADARLEVRNNSSNVLQMLMSSSGYSPGSGVMADGARLLTTGAGGLSIVASHAAGEIRWYTASSTNLRWTMNASGHIVPNGCDVQHRRLNEYGRQPLCRTRAARQRKRDRSAGHVLQRYELGPVPRDDGRARHQRPGRSAGASNAVGDWIVGASSHIFVSPGTESVTAGGGSGAAVTRGVDSAFTLFSGSTASTTMTVTFAHTFSTIPTCIVHDNAAKAASFSNITTGQIDLAYTSATGIVITVVCFGS
jgi:hypothetical protein